MTVNPEHILPQVDKDDILQTDIDHLLNRVDDKDSRRAFKRLFANNRVLAEKILYEAFHRSGDNPIMQDKLLSFGIYVVDLLETASERERNIKRHPKNHTEIISET
jgi:hypothetical protein